MGERLRSRDAMKGKMDRRAIYGGKEFASRLKKMYGIEESIKTIGRPRKSQNKK